ncbi:hypothetical protein AVEN_179595-1 [Araneus ventricosus]|uniref:RNase H type-1 domain-containing protein n=1 Tax=Araneus ventricosus TaxID=182803 RepID=A0A4Y2BCQ5_ARAVE|nr:hypothetical protein AVEN_179595-1 [Araneus ventricosus]
MVLHGAAAWAYLLSARQERQLNPLQRKFLLNISGAYSTTPTAALQVIERLLPLHLKAEQEAVYFRVTRLVKASHLKGQNFDPKDFEDKVSTAKFHPASFDLESHFSFDHIFNTDGPINICTDGSKIDDRSDCAFCVRENNISTSQWMAQLKHHNSVFQAEDIQSILLNSPNIKLCWIKAQVGHAGNEAADLLAKKATLEGITTQYPAPRSFLKKKLHAISTQLWQNEWDNGDTGRNVHLILPKVKTSPAPWQRPEIMFVTGHGPFPTYFKRFGLKTTDYWWKPSALRNQLPPYKLISFHRALKRL